MQPNRHKVPFKLKLFIAKESKPFRILDIFISKIKPARKYKGKPAKILFIRNDRIGDAIVTLPVLRDLKLNYPEIKIHILTSNRNRFVFNELNYIDKVILFAPEYMKQDVWGIYKLLFFGDILLLFNLFIFPYIFKRNFRNEIKKLRQEKYDAAVDFTGEKFNLILSKLSAKYSVGSWIFGLFWLYTYYINTNWVSHFDEEFMTWKIERCLNGAFGFEFKNRDKSPIFTGEILKENPEKQTDIFIHLGTSELRKLPFQKEQELIESLSKKKLLITDSKETERYNFYLERYKNYKNIKFKLYNKLQDAIEDAALSKILLCYDGGQALYLSQFLKAIVIYGPGSIHLWKPYEFKEYRIMREWNNGVKAIQSKGIRGHTAIYYPIWCSPCYDIGCDTRPCLNNINAKQIVELVE